jgi:hypothetical protein
MKNGYTERTKCPMPKKNKNGTFGALNVSYFYL